MHITHSSTNHYGYPHILNFIYSCTDQQFVFFFGIKAGTKERKKNDTWTSLRNLELLPLKGHAYFINKLN